MAVTVREISGSALDQLIREGKILVVFYSTTCGPCKMLRFVLKDIAREVDDVAIFEIDFDQNKETAAEYGVEGYPTILFYQNGCEKTRLKGLQQKPVILRLMKA